MKKLFCLLVTTGVVLIVYSVAGKYLRQPTVSLGGLIAPAKAAAAMLTANSVLLMALLVALKDKVKGLAAMIAIAGLAAFACGAIGRTIGVQTVSFLGWISATRALTLVIVANTLMLLSVILAVSCSCDKK